MDADSTGAQTWTWMSPGITSRSKPLLANVEDQLEAADSTPSLNLAPIHHWASHSWFQNWNLNLLKSKPSTPNSTGSSIHSSTTASNSECPTVSESELDDIPESLPGAFQSLHPLAHSLINNPVAPESTDENPSPVQGHSGASDQTGTWAANWEYSSTLQPLKLVECILSF